MPTLRCRRWWSRTTYACTYLKEHIPVPKNPSDSLVNISIIAASVFPRHQLISTRASFSSFISLLRLATQRCEQMTDLLLDIQNHNPEPAHAIENLAIS